ncbi:3,4-dihydroxyphenylacetaldehyde synthase-like, partial [Condylostylus longicornis]|uniref:3,4-dihydroxyphenylacetaldehyde synthase-like n=1 Tax=Condylostylus longicornis TaxID=2530218 RepID=UPI00244E3DD0
MIIYSDVLPSVQPGYLHNLIPNEAPENPENWNNVLDDFNKFIMPGLTHWQSPYFHAYFPTTTSYPSMVAEFIAAGISVLNFSWVCSPAATELEAIVCDWIAKFIQLPEKFLNLPVGNGGGSLHNSASDAILTCVIAAREKNFKELQKKFPKISKHEILSKFIGYASDQSNSSIEKAGLLSAIPIRLLQANENFEIDGEILRKAVIEDLNADKIPIIFIASYGTTGLCSFDNIDELASVCKEYNIWLHIDAAYAAIGNALPELDFPYKNGFNYAHSINFNLPKSMLINYDCCALWLENVFDISKHFNVDRIYLKHYHENESTIAPDYRNWQLALGKRFKALKVWIVMRILGMEEIRNYVRKTFKLAEYFEQFLLSDDRFEIIGKRRAGLVCFRIKNNNNLTTK